MGVMSWVMDLFFGGKRNIIAETTEVFRENADKAAQRATDMQSQAMVQFASEFAMANKSRFDHLVDGLNRLPRPMLAFGTIGLFGMAMHDPEWFADRMQGLALVPEPLWWLMGAIISFYFGARHQMKHQDFQDKLMKTADMVRTLPVVSAQVFPPHDTNPALQDWRRTKQ